MKSFIYTIILTSIFATSVAQTCSDHVFFKKNAVLQFGVFNSRGATTGNIEFSVQTPTQKPSSFKSLIQTRFLNRQLNAVYTMSNSVKCDNEILFVDFKMVIPREQLEQLLKAGGNKDDVFVEYPLKLKSGDALKDAKLSVSSNENGIHQSATMEITKRKVLHKEKVTTKVGSWDAHQITSLITINVQTGPIAIPLKIQVTEWFVPHLGVVKAVFDNGNYQELTALR